VPTPALKYESEKYVLRNYDGKWLEETYRPMKFIISMYGLTRDRIRSEDIPTQSGDETIS
jgi:hypothetical protein